jgi:hypothetical protein
MRTKIKFKFEGLKITFDVRLPYGVYAGKPKTRAIFDTGCDFTTISYDLLSELKYDENSKALITINGINSSEKSFSYIIPEFVIGNINLGRVRVAVGSMRKEYNSSVLLGMNVLMWFSYGISLPDRLILLQQHGRSMGGVDMQEGLIKNNPKTLILSSDVALPERTNTFFIDEDEDTRY